MAIIRKEILLESSAENVWAAVRDVGALHHRLVPGFVVDTRLEEGARVVTFGNGVVVRELIVDLDDDARRLAWIADLLPNELAGDIRAMIDQAAAVMKKTLDGR